VQYGLSVFVVWYDAVLSVHVLDGKEWRMKGKGEQGGMMVRWVWRRGGKRGMSDEVKWRWSREKGDKMKWCCIVTHLLRGWDGRRGML
jgi:hypothetical protein